MHATLEAYELAWAEVMARAIGYDAPAARELLAKRIIKAAMENGERDLDRLKAYALEGFQSLAWHDFCIARSGLPQYGARPGE